MKHRLLRILVVPFTAVLLNQPVHAQPGLAVVVLGGRAVRGIIKDFRKSAGQLIAEGRDNANLAVSHAGDELNVATRNVEGALNGVLDKSFDKLDVDQRNLFARLNDMLSEAKNVRDSVAGVEDYASIDLEQRLGALPLVDARAFYVRRVDGLVLQKQELPYTSSSAAVASGTTPAASTTWWCALRISRSRSRWCSCPN